jgi:hypothetical protein
MMKVGESPSWKRKRCGGPDTSLMCKHGVAATFVPVVAELQERSSEVILVTVCEPAEQRRESGKNIVWRLWFIPALRDGTEVVANF